MSMDRQFRCTPTSVPQARRFVVETLFDLPDASLKVVALMVSELATNCVLYAMTDFDVSIERTDDHIHIAVIDTGAGEPEIRWPSTSEPHGRGLHIVEELSDDWGVTPSTEHAGKTVWFTLALSAHPNDLTNTR